MGPPFELASGLQFALQVNSHGLLTNIPRPGFLLCRVIWQVLVCHIRLNGASTPVAQDVLLKSGCNMLVGFW